MKIIIHFKLKIMSSFQKLKDMEFALDMEFVPNHHGLEHVQG